MKQMFDLSPSMTHPFLKYAESAQIDNEKVLRLIDELRAGLSEEDSLQRQDPRNRLYFQKQKNVMTCYCILLHVLCLADLSDNREPYDCFIDGWNNNTNYH